MSEEIIKVLDNLGERFGIAIDWTSQNVMPYIQDLGERFIKYRTATGILQIIICAIILIISIIATKKLIKWSKSEEFNTGYNDDGCLFVIGMFFTITIAITAVCFISSNIFEITQNIFMPEITIIDYLKGMM